MVGSVPVTPGPTPTRRALLVGGMRVGLLGLAMPALAACTADGRPSPPPPPDPDVGRADEAAERERRLLAAYDAAVVLAPALADLLTPLRAEHAEHLAALGVAELPAPTADPSAPPPVAVLPPPPALPSDPAALRAALAELERATANVHGDAAVLAGRGLAVVLASLAASEASHPVALA